jgi:peptide deformylase
MILNLVPENDELLSTKLKAFDFDEFDSELLKKNLLDSMIFYEGIGLAANQVGINARVFAMVHEKKSLIVINPEIITVSEEKIKNVEGCLSFKGLYPKVMRPIGVSAKFKNEKNEDMMLALTGLSARVFLHEYDHLNGIKFHDRTTRYDMSIARRKSVAIIRKMKKEKNGSKNY